MNATSYDYSCKLSFEDKAPDGNYLKPFGETITGNLGLSNVQQYLVNAPSPILELHGPYFELTAAHQEILFSLNSDSDWITFTKMLQEAIVKTWDASTSPKVTQISLTVVGRGFVGIDGSRHRIPVVPKLPDKIIAPSNKAPCQLPWKNPLLAFPSVVTKGFTSVDFYYPHLGFTHRLLVKFEPHSDNQCVCEAHLRVIQDCDAPIIATDLFDTLHTLRQGAIKFLRQLEVSQEFDDGQHAARQLVMRPFQNLKSSPLEHVLCDIAILQDNTSIYSLDDVLGVPSSSYKQLFGSTYREFWRSPDGKQCCFYSLKPNLLSILLSGPFGDWTDFLEPAKTVLSAYRQADSHARLEQISLRYVNRIAGPKTLRDLPAYFTMLPEFANPIDLLISKQGQVEIFDSQCNAFFRSATVMDLYYDGNDEFKLRYGLRTHPNDADSHVLDLRVTWRPSRHTRWQTETIIATLDELRAYALVAFHTVITENVLTRCGDPNNIN